jgi:dihydrolipoamide dehydrogenase
MSEFDLTILGAGPGGYVAAIRAAQLGMKVAVIEKRQALGGTCLNIGCIPSKALLNSSEKFESISSSELRNIGIYLGAPKLDISKMMGNKNRIVTDLTKGIEFLFKKNKITSFIGNGYISSPNEITVSNKNDSKIVRTQKILIATGSDVAPLNNINIDEKKIVSSTGALELTTVPKKFVVVGGGYIGLEMGTVWRRLGSEVTVIEYLDRILPGMDSEIAKKFKLILQKQGIKFELNTAIQDAKIVKNHVQLTALNNSSKEKLSFDADVVLIATGRIPNTSNIGLEDLSIKLSQKGQVLVNDEFQTNIPNIYAIGDVIPGPMLAHKAEEDGVAAVEIMNGVAGHVDYNLVPGIVYTSPEVATLGKTEDELKDNNIQYNKGVFPFSANSRARAINHTDGLVKMLTDKNTDKVLGVHIIGHEAGNLVHEVATAMSFGGSAEDIARTCHGHPTLNEAVKEAALAAGTGAIHI